MAARRALRAEFSELAAAYFAVHAAGGVAVLLNADAPAESVRWVVEDAEARLLLLALAALALAGIRRKAVRRTILPFPEDLAEVTRADENQPLFSPAPPWTIPPT